MGDYTPLFQLIISVLVALVVYVLNGIRKDIGSLRSDLQVLSERLIYLYAKLNIPLPEKIK